MRGGDLGLEGITVLDASSVIGGPLAATILASFGARVIKVEHPKIGDPVRTMGRPGGGEEAWWLFLSQGKQCVTCNLAVPEGAALFRELVRRADVLVESFRPGTMEKWGLDYSTLSKLNPRLIDLKISAFGQSGPYSDRPGYGTLAEAMSGLAHLLGDPNGPPMLPGVPIADLMVGLAGALSCVVRLYKGLAGDREGHGRVIDVGLYDPLLYLLTASFLEFQLMGAPPMRRGNRLTGGAPRNARQSLDGRWVAYSVQSGGTLARLVEFLGLQEDPRFKDVAQLAQHGDELDRILGEWVAEREREEVLSRLTAAGIPAAPIYDASEVMSDHHFRANGDFVKGVDPSGRVFEVPRGLAHMAANGGDSNGSDVALGGELGKDNDAVYRDWLELSGDELARLRTLGAI